MEIEKLLKELRKDLLKCEKKYFDTEWNPNVDDMHKLKALTIRNDELLQILLKGMELQTELKRFYDFTSNYKKEVERNVLIPKINKE